MLETVYEIEETVTPWESVEGEDGIYRNTPEVVARAEKTLQETDDVMEILESLAIIEGWSQDECIWEYIDLDQEWFVDEIVKCLLEKGYHPGVVSAKIRWFVYENEGCTMFDDYLKIGEGQEDEDPINIE